MNILFVNASVRAEGVSRTLKIARALLDRLVAAYPDSTVVEAALEKDRIQPLYSESLAYRDECHASGRFDDPIYRYARDFAAADIVVFAAPYWDNSFPTLLKAYVEHVMAQGVTFGYDAANVEFSLCRAKKCWYVCSAGGPVARNLGFEYVRSVMTDFFHIPDCALVQVDNIDMPGCDAERMVREKIAEVALLAV